MNGPSDLEGVFAPHPAGTRARALALDASPHRVASAFRGREGFAFLDSSSAGEQARFSVLGWDPPLTFRAKGGLVEVRVGGHRFEAAADPFDVLGRLLRACAVERVPGVPYGGGALGYLGYDLFPFVERHRELRSTDDLGLPDAHLGFHDTVLVYDHLLGTWTVVATPVFRGRGEPSRLIEERTAEVREALSRVEAYRSAETAPGCSIPTSNMTRERYLAAVRVALEHIRAGDIYQVNLSQRFRAALRTDPFDLFTRLRSINPSSYGGFLSCERHTVISSSPELFLRREGVRVETRPIKGTRPRGATPDADRSLERELVASAKDTAELAMIVDLERNDLGRVCTPGSVRVLGHRYVDRLPTVFHTVSTVCGSLRDGVGAVDLLRATFPGGSITGCPKIRSIEIIDALEPTRRHVYTGALGYLGFDGDLTLNIAIRTMVVRDGEVFFQVGGGIVADSTPEGELLETLHKAEAMFRALGAAGSQKE